MWEQLMKNQVLVSSVTGWVVAQFLKTIIDCMLNKSFSPERLVGSGGMPSSHSSTVCALVVSSGLCFGVSSFEFAVSFILAAIVMYDATGVRRETGKQAKLLNMIMEFLSDDEKNNRFIKMLVAIGLALFVVLFGLPLLDLVLGD